MKRILLSESQLNRILNEEEYNEVKCVAQLKTPQEAEEYAKKLRDEIGLEEHECYTRGCRVMMCIEKRHDMPWVADSLFDAATKLGTKSSLENGHKMVSESRPGFQFDFPRGSETPRPQPQAMNTQQPHKGKKQKVKPDYNTVRLVDDPKVRSGEDWGKYGGNFPVERGGHIYYVSRSIAVSIYAFCQDKNGVWTVLANQRGPGAPTSRGLWNVPCGYLDYGESAVEAAARETFEETGVEIPLDKLKMMGVNSEPSRHPHAKDNVTIRFAAVLDGTTDDYPTSAANSEPGEVTDIAWIPFSDIGKYKWAFGMGHKILPQAKTSLNYLNGAVDDNLDNMVKSLKSEIRNQPYAQQLFDNILKKLNYTETQKENAPE